MAVNNIDKYHQYKTYKYTFTYTFLNKTRILGLSVDIVLELFNVCVVPILLYGAEIWGYENVEDLEKFHRQFLRIILKAYKSTPNAMLYGETGAFDLRTRIDSRLVNFWAKLRNCQDTNKISSILCNFVSNASVVNNPGELENASVIELDNAVDNPCELGNTNGTRYTFRWCDRIKTVLCNTGFANVFHNPNLFVNETKLSISRKLKEIFVEGWKKTVQSNSQCSTYKLFKKEHCLEKYLTILDYPHRISVSNFRMRVNNLPVTNNRFAKDKETRSSILGTECPLCVRIIPGDEDHYLFSCPYFQSERNSVFPDDLVTNCRVLRFKKWEFVFREEKFHLTQLSKFLQTIMAKFKIKRKTNVNLKPDFELKERVTKCGRVSKPPARFS